MILTGPEIREQIKTGREMHGKERRVTLPSPSRNLGDGVYVVDGIHRFKDIIDERMNYIDVEPYDKSLVGPNSIDLRIGNELLAYEDGYKRHAFYDGENARYKNGSHTQAWINLSNGFPCIKPVMPIDSILDMKTDNATETLEIPDDGLVLWPGILYLGRTIETIGSNAFVPIVEGRSSVGRLGIHVHVTAGFCDLGFRGTITLEIHVIHPVRIYPNLPLCQAYFLEPRGAIELYKGRYQNQVEPTASRFAVKVENDDG